MVMRHAETRHRAQRPRPRTLKLSRVISLVRKGAEIFIAKNAPSRGAAIAFYAATSLAPILLIVIAVAGAAFGDEAARGAVFAQFRGLLGPDGADLLERTIASASAQRANLVATLIGIGTLILTASGVFLELEDALNDIWGVRHEGGVLSGLVRARLASLGLVAALGFLLLVSLMVDAGLAALGDVVNARWPAGVSVLAVLNFLVSPILIAILFAAIYKLLPAKPLAWPYVIFGAVLTAVLFQAGKFLISLYLGNYGIASSLGIAGALLGLLLWVYYSAQIFLFGAALTKAHYDRSRARHEKEPSVMP
jgi:membrane protein